MIDEEQSIGLETQKPPLQFEDWTPFQEINGLPKDITYIPPCPQQDLRKKLKSLKNCSQDDENLLKMALSFLEKGIMIDKYKGDEKARHEFLLSHRIKRKKDGREITLYELSKKTNKLSGNAISIVLISLGFIEKEENIKLKNSKSAEELKEKIEEIKEKRGYFLTEDLKDIDNAARAIIKYIAGKYGVEI